MTDNKLLANRIAELERQVTHYKDLLESSMLCEGTAKQYAEEVDKQNAALAAQVEALKQSVISTKARGNLLHNITLQILQGAELNSSDWDYISEEQVAEIEHHLAEIRAEAGRAGYLKCLEDTESYIDSYYAGCFTEQHANQYADSIRRGEVE